MVRISVHGILTVSDLHKVQTSLLPSTNHYVNNRCTLQSVTNHITAFKICQCLVTEHPLFSLRTDSKARSCVAFLSLSDIPM